jgi:hypothetical protein
MKLLCGHVIKDLLGDQIDYDKVLKLTTDAKFEISDVKASIAVLSFILSNATKFNVDAESLSNELQQLGLPKEHAMALCKTFEDSAESLRLEFLRRSLRLSRLDSVDWRVDYVLGSSRLKEVCEPFIQLRLGIRNPDTQAVENVSFSLSAAKFRVFLYEMKQAYSVMESIVPSSQSTS